jgi:hypothetical protein
MRCVSPKYRLSSKDRMCIPAQADVGNGAISSHHRSIRRIDKLIGHKQIISDLHAGLHAGLVYVSL